MFGDSPLLVLQLCEAITFHSNSCCQTFTSSLCSLLGISCPCNFYIYIYIYFENKSLLVLLLKQAKLDLRILSFMCPWQTKSNIKKTQTLLEFSLPQSDKHEKATGEKKAVYVRENKNKTTKGKEKAPQDVPNFTNDSLRMRYIQTLHTFVSSLLKSNLC